MPRIGRVPRIFVIVACVVSPAATVTGQEAGAAPIEKVTFEQAVDRAIRNNPSVAQAAAGILRAEAIYQQRRAGTLPTADANLATQTIAPVPSFSGSSITPRTQLTSALGIAVPLIDPVAWAVRNQAGDQVQVAQRTVDEVRRQIAIAAAQSYLQIIGLRRVLETNERARDTARAHFTFATQRFEGGVGSRLNQLRAQEELSADETRVEAARLALRRAQEALGVLAGADGPLDAAGEPIFELPPEAAEASMLSTRSDFQVLTAREAAAERVVRDSPKDRLPSVSALFDPRILAPSGLFQPAKSVSARVVFTLPLFDGGRRKGLERERQSLLDVVRFERVALEREARAEVRTAREAVQSSERALASARAAAEQSAEVVRITDVAFRAGATTNLEVIDAQRRARDADTVAAVSEDAVRRARFELLVAVGAFPR
jgi:outer membrane protein TolC